MLYIYIGGMVFNATFNNTSAAISLLVMEAGEPREKHRSGASH